MFKKINLDRLSQEQILLLSQFTISVCNILPICVGMIRSSSYDLGILLFYQSLYIIFVTVLRAGIGLQLLKFGASKSIEKNQQLALFIMIFLPAPFLIIFNSSFDGMGTTGIFLLYFIIIFGIVHEFIRYLLMSWNELKHLFCFDFIILFTFLMATIFANKDFDSNGIFKSWFFSLFMSLLYIGTIRNLWENLKFIGHLSFKKLFEVFVLSLIPLITFSSVFFVNAIWTLRFGPEPVGVVRSIFVFFTPIQFVISAFPFIIFKSEKLIKDFAPRSRLVLLAFSCSTLAVVWLYYRQFPKVEILLLVLLVNLSLMSTYLSQDISLKMIKIGKLKIVVVRRIVWSISLLLTSSLIPNFGYSALNFAAVLTFSDIIFYRLISYRQNQR